MNDGKIKLSYIPQQLRVRCEFTKWDCQQSLLPPPSLLLRAKAKLQEEQQEGKIAFYRFFEARLNKIWEIMQKTWEDDSTKVSVTLAAGSPHLEGLEVKFADNIDYIANISFHTPSQILKTWSFPFVKLTVGKLLRDIGIFDIANPAEIHRAWLRACSGEKIINFPLARLPKLEETKNNLPFKVLINELHKHASLVVYNVNALLNQQIWTDALKQISEAAKFLSQQENSPYKTLYPDIVRSLRSAKRGPERYGVDLPMVFLAAIPNYMSPSNALQKPSGRRKEVAVIINKQPTKSKTKLAKQPVIKKADQKQLPLELNFEISGDQMSAIVKTFNPSNYNLDKPFTLAIFEEQMRKTGIVFGYTQEIKDAIREKIKNRESLGGVEIAKGVPPQAAEQPFLRLIFKETDHEATTDSKQVDKNYVKINQLIAVIEYEKPAVNGRNVLGQSLEPQPPPELQVTAEEGVVRKDNEFFSTVFGTVEDADGKLKIKPGLIHNGDVNATSGSINFNGPTQIVGCIDKGAVVEVFGDVFVKGNINGGIVKVSGSLEVTGGINTAYEGIIYVKGDLKANYIENTKIKCLGNVYAEKAIVTSNVNSFHNIEVLGEKGLILSGHLRSFNHIICQNIGKSDGKQTILEAGVDWKTANSIYIRRTRLQKLSNLQEELLKEKRELTGKTEAQLTEKHRALKIGNAEKLERVTTLIRNLEVSIDNVKKLQKINTEAKIIVKNILSKNCTVSVADKNIPLTEDIAAVVISTKRHKGSNIAPIDESTMMDIEQKKAS